MTRTLLDRGGTKVTYSRRSSKAPCGRFGGGWQWKVGVQAGGSRDRGTVLVSLLVAELTIRRRPT